MRVTFTVSILAVHSYAVDTPCFKLNVSQTVDCDPVAKKVKHHHETNRNIYKTHESAQQW